MIGFLKLKILLVGTFFASPMVAVWVLQAPELAPDKRQQNPAAPEPVERVPVEVISTGSGSKWIYVEVGGQAVPEPGVVSLAALTALLAAFRRQR